MKLSSLRPRAILAVLIAGIVSAPGCAEGPPRRGGPNGGPPPQALDACASRPANASCYFEHDGHAITGSCQERGRDWVCVPDREPPGGRGAPGDAMVLGGATAAASTQGPPSRGQRQLPPQEAIDACRMLLSGASCVVQTTRGGIDGRCSYSGETLACIPSDPSHRPIGGPEGPAMGDL
ncbi:hypothetical protein [Thiorhodococcus minor]|uniref:DUF333 domain-containing protein n=1 Tax=Thiorhodococcus minor TaxID=57489 RepID=A0A6M0JU11_9GAMM|nr:hypothetical protein [Thiorhodococcus minor]NEV61040.1 hypothetical protein [Thiorhodococcus minor]